MNIAWTRSTAAVPLILAVKECLSPSQKQLAAVKYAMVFHYVCATVLRTRNETYYKSQ